MHHGSYSTNLRLKQRLYESARRALRLRYVYVGASSSRVRLATPDGPSQRITRSSLPSSSFPSPPALTLLSPRRVSISPPPSRPSSSQTRDNHTRAPAWRSANTQVIAQSRARGRVAGEQAHCTFQITHHATIFCSPQSMSQSPSNAMH